MTGLLGTQSSIQDVALVFQPPDLQNSVIYQGQSLANGL